MFPDTFSLLSCLNNEDSLRQGEKAMKYTQEYVSSRIGEKGYLDLVAIFLTLGFNNVNEVPEALWEGAVRMYEEQMFRRAA